MLNAMPSEIRILHTNDFHGSLNQERFEALTKIRKERDLYFDSGDLIKTGNLGIPTKPDPGWAYLAKLDCSASVPGNRESQLVKAAFDAKLAGHVHPLLCANLFDRQGNRPLADSIQLDIQGLKVGVLGVMVPMVTERMASKALSQYLWTQPIDTALELAGELRKVCDRVIALTHIGLRNDVALAEASDSIDLIFGGHSHSVLEQPQRVANAWICQGGSHGRFYGDYVWNPEKGTLTGGLVPFSG